MDDKLYHEIVMTRETVPVGEDIGFLPGTEEEKMAPWMGALIDNLELLGKQEEDTDWEKDVTKNILMNKIKIRSLNFMRGRTFYYDATKPQRHDQPGESVRHVLE
jgi:PhoH-like ATPase